MDRIVDNIISAFERNESRNAAEELVYWSASQVYERVYLEFDEEDDLFKLYGVNKNETNVVPGSGTVRAA